MGSRPIYIYVYIVCIFQVVQSSVVQTGPGAHPASCTMGTGSFPGVKSGRGLTLTPHPLLVPWSERVELYLYSTYGPCGLYRASVPVQGWTVHLLCLFRLHVSVISGVYRYFSIPSPCILIFYVTFVLPPLLPHGTTDLTDILKSFYEPRTWY